MPRINLDDKGSKIRTSLFFGCSGSGKTVLSCTLPRVAWFGSAREGGYETVRFMPRDLWYESNVRPQAYAVSNIKELNNDLNEVWPKVKTGEIKTIILELSFFSDDIIRDLKTKSDNTWAVYGALEEFMINFDARAKQVPGLRINYNALSVPSSDAKHPSGISMPGKAVPNKLPAGLDLTGYLRAEENGGKVERVLHLAPYSNFPARHRYGDLMPPVVRNPTFRKLEGLLNGTLVADVDGNVSEREVVVSNVVGIAGLPPLRAK